jgi:hypothetical protein
MARKGLLQFLAGRDREVGEIETGSNEAGYEGPLPERPGSLENSSGNHHKRLSRAARSAKGTAGRLVLQKDDFQWRPRKVHPRLLASHPVKRGELPGGKKEVNGGQRRTFTGITGQIG